MNILQKTSYCLLIAYCKTANPIWSNFYINHIFISFIKTSDKLDCSLTSWSETWGIWGCFWRQGWRCSTGRLLFASCWCGRGLRVWGGVRSAWWAGRRAHLSEAAGRASSAGASGCEGWHWPLSPADGGHWRASGLQPAGCHNFCLCQLKIHMNGEG